MFLYSIFSVARNLSPSTAFPTFEIRLLIMQTTRAVRKYSFTRFGEILYICACGAGVDGWWVDEEDRTTRACKSNRIRRRIYAP